MQTSKRVRVPLPSLLRSIRSLERRVLIKAWEISGTFVARYYGQLLYLHGDSPKALAERDSSKDFEFYERLFRDVAPPAQVSVLDIGCGMGDLIDYLQSRHVGLNSYLGIDLLEAFIDICRREYLPPCRFERMNFVSPSFAPREQFDLVVNMGVLVSRVICYEAYIAYCVEKMLTLSRKHVLFNVITEVDHSAGNYRSSGRIGQITYLPRQRLEQILARVTRDIDVTYVIHEERIYSDAVDAFVHIVRH